VAVACPTSGAQSEEDGGGNGAGEEPTEEVRGRYAIVRATLQVHPEA
jgi:hypothetical protein